MANLSDVEIAVVMLAAGFPANKRVLAEGIGVVHAESGGDPKSKVPGNEHMGMWAESSAFGSESERLNAYKSTVAARKQWEADGKTFYNAWGRWEQEQAGQNGAATYRQHMGAANHAIRVVKENKVGKYKDIGFLENLPEGPVAGKVAEGILGAIGGGTDKALQKANVPVLSELAGMAIFFQDATKLLLTPQGWLQIGQVLGGIILIGWGTHKIISASTGVDVARTATRTATKAAEVAAVVK